MSMRLPLLLACLLTTLIVVSACRPQEAPEDEFKALLASTPDLVLGNDWSKVVGVRRPPESLAEQIFAAGGEPARFKLCAAERIDKKLGKRSRCRNEEDDDKSCLLQSGYWKGNLRFQLDALTIDLNHDDRRDYLILPRDCTGLVADNGTATLFVMIGKTEGGHEPSVIRAATLRVLPERIHGANALFGTAPAGPNAEYGRIYTYHASKYTVAACYFRRWEAGEQSASARYRKIDCPT